MDAQTGDAHLQPMLVMKLYPFKIYFACTVPNKGYNAKVAKHIAKFSWITCAVLGHHPICNLDTLFVSSH